MSQLEDKLLFQIKAIQLPEPVREHRFHDKRRWRFDFAYPDLMIAIEVEGGIWTGGAHTRGKHFISDCDKYNAAVILGWKVLRFTETHIKAGTALKLIEQAYMGDFGVLQRAD